MTDYTPRVRDRVKVSLEGEITYVTGGVDFITLDGDHSIRVKGATFEKIIDPLPEAIGSVIKARVPGEDGKTHVFIRTTGLNYPWYCPELGDSWKGQDIILDSIILDNGAE